MARTLPKRLHEKHGAFYYVYRNKWEFLSRDYHDALRIYAGKIAPKTGGVPALLDRYIGQVELAESTLKTYKGCVAVLKTVFREFDPHQVRPTHFYQFITAKGISDAMAAHYRSVMVKAFQLAVEEGLVDQNLMKEIKHYSGGKRDREITWEEYDNIRSNASRTMQVMMDVAYLTGQRIGDVRRMLRSDIREDGVYVHQQKVKDVKLLIQWNPDLRAAIDSAILLHTNIRGMTLFHNRRGGILSYSTVRTWWDRACAKAGVEDANMHDLRAKAATDAKRQGIDSMALLGHSSEATHKRYLRGKEVKVVQGVRRVKS